MSENELMEQNADMLSEYHLDYSTARPNRFAEDIAEGKPHPEIYLTAARRFGIPPAEMLVLEDSQNGCLAAVRAGAFTVAVPGEHSLGQDFSMASLTIESLTDPRLYEALGIPQA